MSVFLSPINSFFTRLEENVLVLKASENVFVSILAKAVLSEFGARFLALGLAGGLVRCALNNKYQAGELNKTFTRTGPEKREKIGESRKFNTRANRQMIAALTIVVLFEAIVVIKRW